MLENGLNWSFQLPGGSEIWKKPLHHMEKALSGPLLFMDLDRVLHLPQPEPGLLPADGDSSLR